MNSSSLNHFPPVIEAVAFDHKRATAMIDRACREISQSYIKGCWEWAEENCRAKFEDTRDAERLAERAFIREDLPSLEIRLKEMVAGWKELIEEYEAREQGNLF